MWLEYLEILISLKKLRMGVYLILMASFAYGLWDRTKDTLKYMGDGTTTVSLKVGLIMVALAIAVMTSTLIPAEVVLDLANKKRKG